MPVQWMSREEAWEFLSTQTEGRLATCGVADQPYITPLNFVAHQGKLYFHCRKEGRKLQNIAHNPRVCFEASQVEKLNVVRDHACACNTRYNSVLVFGSAQLVEDEEEKAALLNLLVRRFAGDDNFQPITPAHAAGCAVMEILVDEISGKRNVDA